jgi:lipoate-protein ligase A
MTKEIFAALDVYHDRTPRSAAMNMAIDEALLEIAVGPSIRFYRWNHLALSFGYFGKFSDVARHQSERELVRRWTGGGIVFHGDDLTYSIVIPARYLSFLHSPPSIYVVVHEAIRHALATTGKHAELAKEESPPISESCFANAVRADVLLNGQKVAGAAQRRTRTGLLQQGSIQHVDLAQDFETRFAWELSGNCVERKIDNAILGRAREIAEQKYGSEAWLRKR